MNGGGGEERTHSPFFSFKLVFSDLGPLVMSLAEAYSSASLALLVGLEQLDAHGTSQQSMQRYVSQSPSQNHQYHVLRKGFPLHRVPPLLWPTPGCPDD